jgi:hypothetical protein
MSPQISSNHSSAKKFALRGEHVPKKNARPVSVIHVVPCPICGAKVDERCRTVDGAELNTPHRHRHRLAVRAEFESQP